MTTWILKPRDTLLVRDARPSYAGTGGLRTLDFPWPSSLAGLVRTLIGSAKSGRFDLDIGAAKQIAIRGPLLVELNAAGQPVGKDGANSGLFVPAPSDCIWYRGADASDQRKTVLFRRRLEPVDYRKEHPGFCTDLDGNAAHKQQTQYLLQHRGGTDDSSVGKPVAGCAFWRWTELLSWLLEPPRMTVFSEQPDPDNSRPCIKDFGLSALDREQRTHVGIDSLSQTSSDGMLFVTESLRFTKQQPSGAPKEYGILFACDNPYQTERALTSGLVTFGGERKLSFLSESKHALPPWPSALFNAVSESLASKQRPRLARVVLLTPALFEDGFAPQWIGSLSVKVVAAAVQRPQVVSGWDFDKKVPKPNRRMAAAGSVYWVELPDGLNVTEWLDSVWMKCLPNQTNEQDTNEQDTKDGFGLCAVGVG